MRTLVYSQKADRALARMPRRDAENIEEKLHQLTISPEELAGNIKRLTNSKSYRLTVGQYRVLYDDGIVIDILDIGPRQNFYKRL